MCLCVYRFILILGLRISAINFSSFALLFIFLLFFFNNPILSVVFVRKWYGAYICIGSGGQVVRNGLQGGLLNECGKEFDGRITLALALNLMALRLLGRAGSREKI